MKLIKLWVDTLLFKEGTKDTDIAYMLLVALIVVGVLITLTFI